MELSEHRNTATLWDLLTLIRRELCSDSELSRKNLGRRMSRFSATAALLAESHKVTIETAAVNTLVNGESIFLKHLEKLHLGVHRSSRHMRRREALLRYARQFGFLQPTAAGSEWDPIASAAGYDEGRMRSIAAYAMTNALRPAEFAHTHLRAWRREQLNAGRSVYYVDQVEKAFRRTLRKLNLHKLFPRFDAALRTQPAFGCLLEEMADPLKADVSLIVEWAHAEAAKGALRIGDSILLQLEALCGYAINVLYMEGLDSVDPLLTEKFLSEYVDWLYRIRKRTRSSIRPLISGIHSVLLFHPRFVNRDISWWPKLLGRIEPEPKSACDERRERRTLPYGKLLEALLRMRDVRLSAQNLPPKALAWMYHDELLMTVAVKLLWDPMLIRICRVNEPSASLLKAEVPLDRPGLALTSAAKRALRKNPHVHLWQFDFEREWGVGAFGLVIDDVVPLLDEYMNHHRGVLLGFRDVPGPLFFNRRLGPLTKHTLVRAIGQLTHRYAGRRVTADTLRISFIDHWLIHEKRDYVNLASILMISLNSILQRFDPDYKSPFQQKN